MGEGEEMGVDITERKRMERELRESKERLQAIFSTMTDGITLVGLDGTILDYNDAVLRLHNLSRDEYVGKNVYDFIDPKDRERAIQEAPIVLEKGYLRSEVKALRKEGGIFNAEINVSLLRDASGKPFAFLGVTRDITERKRLEERTRESERKYRSLYEAIKDGIVASDMDGRIIECNQAYADMLGYSIDELKKLTYQQLTPEKWHRMEAEIVEDQIAKRGYSDPYEKEYIRKDGTVFPISIRVWLVRGEDGKPEGMWGIIRDITGRKQIEEALTHERDLLQSLMDNIPDAIYFKDAASRFMRINRAHAQRMGVDDPEEAIGKTDFDFYSEEFAGEAYADEQKIVKSGQPLISKVERVVMKDGQFRWVSATKVPIKDENGQTTGVVGISRDITDLKRMEEALRESEEKYRTLFEEAMDAIFVADAETGIIFDCNRAASELVGREKSELVGKHQRILHPPQEVEGEFSRTFKQHLEEKEGWVLEAQVITKKGEVRDVAIKANVFEFRGKKVIQGIFHDITERNRAEKALRESEEKYRMLMEEAPIGICNVDLKGEVTYVNQRFEVVSGYSREEVVGKSGFKLGMFPYEILKIFVERAKDKLMGKPSRLLETRFKCKDGRWIWVEIEGRVIKKHGLPVGFQLISRDITDRKKAEEALREHTERLEELVEERARKLREAERLAAIGETAAMVGHDLRNPLQVITNAVYILEESAKEVDSALTRHRTILDLLPKSIREQVLRYVTRVIEERNETIRIIDESVSYANKVVSDMYDYARPVKPQPVETTLHQLIEDALSTMNVPETVEVSIVVEESFPRLMVDPALMRRVFTNLVTNALQAMPEGGRLTIRASKTEEAALVSVEDTGEGIPKENLDKIFQPLFTTRAKGVGFGLPICKRMVEAHDGTITVESEAGKGSTFTVKIPLRKEVSQSG